MKKFIIFLYLSACLVSYSQYSPILVKEKFINNRKGLNSVWRQVKISEKFYNQHNIGGYMFALDGYLMGYEYNKNYPELNYKIGICYLNSYYKTEALKYLKKAYSQKPKVTPDIFWQLALAYQYKYEFDSALMYLDSCKIANLKNISNDKIERKIEECKRGKIMLEHPTDVVIENIKDINTEFPEYCPVIVADQSRIYFTARRPDCVGGTIDPNDGQFYEDIYMSDFVNGKWTAPVNVGYPLNTRSHDATVAISPDGNSMLIYRNGDLLISHKIKGKWSYPEYLPDNINTDEIENSACFSFDGKTIYFVRGEKEDPDKSNSDIYITHFRNNHWTDPERLPDVINSKYDEDGVFLHPDGRTLYFSSKGHNSMGGFDIFKSVKQPDGTWSKPVNLGYPVNSPDDDIYFVLSADGSTGYYSSIRKDTKGFSDIYKLKFKPQSIVADTQYVVRIDTIVTKVPTANEVHLTLVTGTIYDGFTKKPVPNASIEVYDNTADSLLLTTYSNEYGKYVLTLPSGFNYGLNINSEGLLFHSENFDLPENQTFKKVVKDIVLDNVTAGKKIVLNNIFFDFDKASLKKESIPELQRVYQFLKANPNLIVEISGHTDNVGSHEYNQKLSEARAKAVVDYLIDKGINPARIKYRGAAYDEPLVPNDTEEHRKMNRRVEFKILSVK